MVFRQSESCPNGQLYILRLPAGFVARESALFVLLFRWHSCSFQQICHDLMEMCSVFGGDDGDTCAILDCLSCNPSSFTALTGDSQILRKCPRRFLLGYFCGGRLRQHIQYQLQRGHVVAEVFFLQALKVFILPCGHPRPCTGYLIGKYCVLHALLYATSIPLVRQFLADLDGCNRWLIHSRV